MAVPTRPWRAAAIVDHHLLPQPRLHLGLYGARNDVGSAAGRKRNHQPDRPLRIRRFAVV
jgi:hypothetical protein